MGDTLRVAGATQVPEKLTRGPIAQRLVGPHGVVDSLPLPELAVDGPHRPLELGHLAELLGIRLLGAFDVTIELRGPGRRDEEVDTPALALALELGEEHRAPIDLDRAQREVQSRLEEALAGPARGALDSGYPNTAVAGSRRPVAPIMTSEPFPRAALERSICDHFEEQVAQHGHRLALTAERAALTYAALDREANRVAHAILGCRRPPQEPIALVFEHGASEIAAILGVLKAGHPFVPLDPSAPPAAVASLLEDSTAGLILTSAQSHPRLCEAAFDGPAMLVLETLDPALPTDSPTVSRSPEALACIMYTSGSTGRPKGVMHTHRTVLHRVLTFANSAGLGPDDRVALLVPCRFSASLRLVFGALLTGAALCPFDVAAAGPDALARWVAHEQITIYSSAPAVLRGFAGALPGPEALPSLRLLRNSSDALRVADVALYRERFSPRCVLMHGLSSNEAGPIAEHVVDPARLLTGRYVPAGFAVPDKEVIVVDDTAAPVRPGEVGEIVVRSRYLSPGYWRRPDLTAAAYRADPEGGDARLYFTGDLGRLAADGCLEVLGRKDLRVKLRGQRVEVSEIEAALVELGAQDAVVVGREDAAGERRLVAYVVPGGGPALTVSSLRRGLARRLPRHMVPSAFVVLDVLPRTANGKVDRGNLPNPEPVRPQLDNPFEAPRTPVEKVLAAIWSEALGLDRVGIHDHFLDLGGHSLLATQVISRVIRRFAVDIPVRALFDAPTIAAMAVVVVQHLVTLADDEALTGP
jgi:amino acid adenylation domain-containing protein